jgi:hypothetical protein
MLDALLWWIWPDNMMDGTFLDEEGVIHRRSCHQV